MARFSALYCSAFDGRLQLAKASAHSIIKNKPFLISGTKVQKNIDTRKFLQNYLHKSKKSSIFAADYAIVHTEQKENIIN